LSYFQKITIGDEVHSFNKVILDTDRNSIYTSEVEPMVLNFIQTDKNNTVITYGHLFYFNIKLNIF
jgi:hypothetical protein